jgi:hypothetical protein
MHKMSRLIVSNADELLVESRSRIVVSNVQMNLWCNSKNRNAKGNIREKNHESVKRLG